MRAKTVVGNSPELVDKELNELMAKHTILDIKPQIAVVSEDVTYSLFFAYLVIYEEAQK